MPASARLAGVLLGAAAAVAGAPQLGTAIMAGGATVGQRGPPEVQPDPGGGGRPGRGHLPESAADVAGGAARLLPRAGDPEPADQRRRQRVPAHPSADQRPHRLPRAAGRPVALSGPPSPALSSMAAYARVVAKLDGFLSDPTQVLQQRSERQRARPLCARGRLLPHPGHAQGAGAGRRPDRGPCRRTRTSTSSRARSCSRTAGSRKSIQPYRDALRYRPDSALIRFGLGAGADGVRPRRGSGRGGGAAARGGADRAAERWRLAVPRHRRGPAGQRGRRLAGAGRAGGARWATARMPSSTCAAPSRAIQPRTTRTGSGCRTCRAPSTTSRNRRARQAMRPL